MIIRKAIPSDIIDLISLAEELCEEMNYEYDLTSIKNYLNTQMTFMQSLVAIEDDTLVGAISFMVVPNQFKHDKLEGKKYAIFVTKNYRNKGIAKELTAYAENICKVQGATKFYFTSKMQPEGYTEVEKEWVKEL